MTTKVWINGAVSDEADARISVFDRGFLYGDSVYEVLRTAGGHPVDLEPHLGRLRRSAAGLALPAPADEVLRRAIDETLRAAANSDSYVRVIVTRGAGEIGLDLSLAVDPLTIVIVRPLVLPAAELYERGASLEIVGVERTSPRAVDPALKSGNYLNSILALAEARRAGAYEALMCDAQGRVAEGSTSNLFIVRAGRVETPASEVGLLAGITRHRIMGLARDAGLEVTERTLMPADVRTADEVFITSSIRGILPIAKVDGSAIGTRCPGAVTARLAALYRDFLDRVGRGG
jgi:branched-chain amino acid aminotransferase